MYCMLMTKQLRNVTVSLVLGMRCSSTIKEQDKRQAISLVGDSRFRLMETGRARQKEKRAGKLAGEKGKKPWKKSV